MREFGQHAVEFVFDQRRSPCRARRTRVRPSFLANVFGAEAVQEVDGVDDNGFKRVIALGDFRAGRKEVGQLSDGLLVDIQRVEAGFRGQEDGIRRLRGEGRFPDFARSVEQD